MRPRIQELLAGRLGTGFFVPTYDLMLALAVVLGVYITTREAERKGLDVEGVFRVCVFAVIAGFVGARLYVVLTHAGTYTRHPLAAVRVWDGGLASMGAYAAGLAGALLAVHRARLPAGKVLDCCAPAAVVGILVGRFGCFLNGCCHGRVADLPWAVRFPTGSDPHVNHLAAGLVGSGDLSLPVHPTQLYEAGFALALLPVLRRRKEIENRDGALLATFFLLYGLGRFVIEFFRGDPRPFLGMLSMPQLFCVAAVAAAALFLWRAPGAERARFEALPPPEARTPC